MSNRNRRRRRAAWPKPGKLVVHLPNDHLQYAVTWYGLALMLVIVFVAFAVKSRREAARQLMD